MQGSAIVQAFSFPGKKRRGAPRPRGLDARFTFRAGRGRGIPLRCHAVRPAPPPSLENVPATPELVLIIPVYNEHEAIPGVLAEWRAELARHTDSFQILVIDDGSRDSTPEVLAKIAWPELSVHRHANRGHGQSCLAGYLLAAERNATYVFQIDSDGQCDPAGFGQVWARRGQAAAIYGRRTSRADGWARVLISRVLRLTLRLAFKTKLNDTNVPFRLYRAAEAAETARRIPGTFDLANIAMALLLEPRGFLEVPIHFRDRMGGHASVRWTGFWKKAWQLRRQLADLKHAGVL